MQELLLTLPSHMKELTKHSLQSSGCNWPLQNAYVICQRYKNIVFHRKTNFLVKRFFFFLL